MIHWAARREHDHAVEAMHARGRRRLCLVDCARFIVMPLYDVRQALALDTGFHDEGFAIYEP